MRADCDPAAMMQWSNETVLTPSLVSTASRCGEANWPRPSTTVTLRALARPPRPPVSLFTTPSLNLRRPSRSIFGLPNDSPRCAPSSASVITFAAWSKRLRRNAADVQADAADARVALDQDHLLAEVGGPKRRGVAAGPGAEHQHLGVEGRVGVLRGARPWRHGRGSGRTGRGVPARRGGLLLGGGRRRLCLRLGLRFVLRVALCAPARAPRRLRRRRATG